jgi:hypothetical protein
MRLARQFKVYTAACHMNECITGFNCTRILIFVYFSSSCTSKYSPLNLKYYHHQYLHADRIAVKLPTGVWIKVLREKGYGFTDPNNTNLCVNTAVYLQMGFLHIPC